VSVPVTISSAGTLGTISVLTGGAAGLDFASASGGTCATGTSYGMGTSCTVNVTFKPKYAGSRYGALVLRNGSGNVLGTSYIYGVGTGPQLIFNPAAQSVVAASLSHPTDLAVDGAGNVYTTEYFGNDALKETLSNGTYTQSTVTTGLSGPFGVAVDGAGNVYIADSGNNRVLKETPSNGSYIQTVIASGLKGPYKVAVDGNGNVYIAEYTGNDVLEETLSGGSYTQSVVASGLEGPWGIVVDGNGNVYIAEYTGNDVLEETLSGGSYAQSTVATGLGSPQSVAVDGLGNVYIGDSGSNEALKETLSNGSYTQSILTTGLNDPSGIAADGLGNVYIADSGNGQLLKEDYADAPRLSFASTAVGSTSSDSPQTLTLENLGNASLTFPVPSSGNNPSIGTNFVLGTGGGSACPVVTSGSSAATLGAEQSCTLAISFHPTATGSLTGAATLTDNTLNAVAPDYATQNIQLSGSSTGSTAQTITFNSISAQQVGGSVALVATASSGLTVSFTSETTSVCTVSGSTATLLTAGTCTIQATQPGNSVYAPAPAVTQSFTVESTSGGGQTGTNFGSVNIGTMSAAVSVQVTISSAGTLGSIEALTSGVTGLDFASTSGGTCATGTSYSTGNTCTVNVTFTPKYAGSRYGAVVLEDSSGNILGTAYIYGAGAGPQVVFSPATQSVAAQNLSHPTDLAVDGAGNVYTVEYYGNDLLKETLSNGTYTQSTVATGLNGPFGVAVDGAGAVYIADSGNNRVLKETPSNGSYIQTIVASGLNGPYKVAVDGNGNVFIAEYTGNDVLEEALSNGSYTRSTVASGLKGPWGVAVDGSGNVYVAEYTGNDVLKETLSNGSYTPSTVAGGLGNPQSVAVDGVGNVYIGDSGNNDALKETLSNGSYTQSVITTGLNDPSGIAIDGAGNVYIADSVNGSLLKEDVADTPSLTFASTAVGSTSSDSPKTVTLENLGNASLIFPVPASGNNPSISTNFVLGTGSGSACPIVASGSSSASLGAGQACTLSISFEPTTTGVLTGTLAITDNALNAGLPGYATQNISLGVLQVAVPIASPVAGAYSPLPTVTLSDATAGATICYTTDDSDPTANTAGTCSHGTAYSAGFSLSGSTTVKAIGTEVGYANSLELTSAYEPPVAVSVSPTSVALYENQSETFTATVTNTTNTAVTWSINPSTLGSISSTGGYIAPATISTLETVTVTATSVADTTKSASATVSLYPPVVITWATPAAINAGTALSATQLNATASVAGTFAYVPAAGSVPAAGTDALSVVFTPTNTTDYQTSYDYVLQAVNGPAPIITTAAGNGTAGYAGDNGPATSAEFYGLGGMVCDSAGNLYIADSYNHRVRKLIIATGIVTTVAGNGVYGYSGDGGPATSAEVSPSGVALDSAGNLYIADRFGSAIRRVDASTGIITTIAGDGTAGYSGDGGSATSAQLNEPMALAFDASGNIYVADNGNNVIRKVNVSSGIITTVAGNGTAADAGDGGLATSAEINDPRGLAIDSAGNVYVSERIGARVREINASTGIIATVAGEGPLSYDYVGDGGPATSALLHWATGVALDGAGNLYIADENAGRVRKVNLSTGIITTVAGDGVEGYSGDGGPATSAEMDIIAGIALDPHGNLYVADAGNFRIREVNYTTAVNWAPPAPIAYGTALSATQLDATANVPGTFAYTPAAGTVPPIGQNTLSVTFTPADTTDYQPVTQTVALTVNPVADSGTVTLAVNGVTAATATYGAGSTTDSVATGLASGMTANSPVNITAVGDELNLEAKAGGSSTNYSYTLATTSYNSQDYSQPSFMNPAASGNLEGGANQNASGGTVYSYSIPSSGGYDANGNLLSYNDSVMGAWAFSYDNLNRLQSGIVTPAADNDTYYCWSYDNWGNRTQQMGSNESISGGGGVSCTQQSGSNVNLSWANYAGNNQMSSSVQNPNQGNGYDAAGDVINDGNTKYLYNADGQICAVSQIYESMTIMTGYIYDADGERVAKGSISSWSCDPSANGFNTQSDYVRDQADHPLSQFSADSNGNIVLQNTNVYAAGTLMATYDAVNLHFYLNDRLGTRRAQTDYQGVLEQTCASLPYGDSETCLPPPSGMLFTGKEKDAETAGGVSPFGVNQGNDYFGARYYASSMGRFMSPDYDDLDDDDPEPVPYADLENPQTLNLYAYGRNNPLGGVDVDGHDGPGLLEAVETGLDEIWAEGLASGWLPAAGAGGVSLGGAATGGIGVIGGAMLFPKDLDPGELTPAQQAAYAAQEKGEDEHKEGRPSTKGKHQKGRARNKRDKGGEKGDKRRQQKGMFQRRPPGGVTPKGGWPPKPGPEGLPLIFLLPNSQDNSSVTTTQGPATPCGGSTGNPCSK
jgi:RHS repeat-associated protein